MEWLEVCQELSRPDVSTKELVESAIELKRLKSKNSQSYTGIIDDYKAKLAALDKLNRKTDGWKRAITDLKLRYETEEKRRQETLDAINRAVATAASNMERHKKEVEISMKEHLAQHNLSWKRIKLVEAIIDAGLHDGRLTRKQQEKIRSEITGVASITNEINQLEQKKNNLELETSRLIEMTRAYTESVDKLNQTEDDVSRSIFRLSSMKEKLVSEVAAVIARLNDMNKELDERIENFYITHLIIDFLFDPQRVTNEDFDVLVNSMTIIRDNRLSMQPRQSAISRLAMKYKGRLPSVYRNFDKHKVNLDLARKALAYLLIPLVKDEMVARYDYDMLKAGYEVSRIGGVTKIRPINRPSPVSSEPPIVVIFKK